MSKIYNYMVFAVGLTFLLRFSGIDTGTDFFFSFLGLSSDASAISNGAFIAKVAALFTIGAGASILIGFITKSTPESFLVGTIAAGLLTVMSGTFSAILTYAQANAGEWLYALLWLIFAPLWIGYVVALINYWRGVDG